MRCSLVPVCLLLVVGACASGPRPPSPPLVDASPAPPPPPPPISQPDAVSTAAPDAPGKPEVDAASARPPDAAPLPPPPEGETFACTLLIGINATAEWYSQGFEKLVDNARWEIMRVHSGFVELWAKPNDAVWSTATSSACAQNPDKPDRIIFVALNFNFTTLEQWLPPLTAAVKNLQAKYPGARRIELATFVRAPGNKPCPQGAPPRSTIVPAEDQAIEMVAATNPQLLRISPKFEAKTCGEFSGNPPHPTAAGGAAWAKMIAEHYGLGK